MSSLPIADFGFRIADFSAVILSDPDKLAIIGRRAKRVSVRLTSLMPLDGRRSPVTRRPYCTGECVCFLTAPRDGSSYSPLGLDCAKAQTVKVPDGRVPMVFHFHKEGV